MLLDRDHIYRNSLQVLNQYATGSGTHDNRYDVTILVNGLPLVHIELKRRGVELRQAFDQIERCQRESFWSGTGLFEYVQVFVISNGRHTKYYSNTTRWQKTRKGGSKKKSSASYQFTSWWTDAANRRVADLLSGFYRKYRSLTAHYLACNPEISLRPSGVPFNKMLE